MMKYNLSYQNQTLPMLIVKEHLDKMTIAYKMLEAGGIEIDEHISDENLERLKNGLEKYSIEILHDQKGQLVQKIKNILRRIAHAEKPQRMTISVTLSSELSLSYGYISNIFTTETHSSIENYVIMLRVERAKRLITEDNMSLKEISSKLHYSSVGHFSRQFKKTTGLTISLFRKIVANKKSNRI